MAKITHIEVTNYRGIAHLSLDIPPKGICATGRNGGGKTSFIGAVRAALGGDDIGPDAIRLDADRSELLVNLDHLQVKRVITEKGTSNLTVRQGEMVGTKPQTMLNEMLGTSVFDPIEFFKAEPKKRVQALLAAMPTTLTDEMLKKYDPEGVLDDADKVGHALVVIERARKRYYELRAAANKATKEAERKAEEAKKLADAAPADDPDLNVSGARVAHEEALAAIVALHSRKQEIEAAIARTASTRTRVESLRDREKELRCAAEQHPGPESVAQAQKVVDEATARVDALKEEIAKLQEKVREAVAELDDAIVAKGKVNQLATDAWEAARHADEAKEQAAELEAAIVAVGTPPTEAEFEALQKKKAEAMTALEKGIAIEKGRVIRATAADTWTEFTKAQKVAQRLDHLVRALTEDAPAELLKASDGIPGISISGDEIFLNRKSIDKLCGAEQMKLAIDIARKLNAKAKILVVDGLEQLDPEQMDGFVEYATRDDWQLIGTRVDRGAVRYQHFEAEAKESAAQ